MKRKTKLIFLIDGNFFAWRAYSTRNLSTSGGIPTSVISGMLQMIKTCYQEFRYDRIVVCWDSPKGSEFRKKLYPEYKANRAEAKKKNKTLFEQIDHARKFFGSLNVRQAILTGIEGDDIMGLVANYYAARGQKIIIATADRDLLQLVTDKIKVFRPNTKELYDWAEFGRKHGITPLQYIKVKSLMGDKGDNVPGIPGIGEKRAMAIVNAFGTLKSIMTCRTTDRYVLLVRKNIKLVNLAYKLVRIMTAAEELPRKRREEFKIMVGRFKGPRRVDWMKMKKQFRLLELRHRNFNAIAEQFSLRVD